MRHDLLNTPERWWRISASGQSCEQIGESAEILVAKMRAACPHDDRGVVRLDVGPVHRQTGKLARVVVEVDAILAPRLPAIDQSKRPPTQRMEGMSDAKGLCFTAC
jgi:hypothetical protein